MERYLITGGAGYVGSALIRHLAAGGGVSITGLVRDLRKAQGILPSSVQVMQADLTDGAAVSQISGRWDHLIHCAGATRSRELTERPVEAVKSIVNTTQNIMELAKRSQPRSVVYLSSMEVYGSLLCEENARATEEDAAKGAVDLLCTRSCYPLGKRMAENICIGYYREYGVPVKIARLAQIFGKGVLPEETRVFAQFARAVRAGKDIVLHTPGRSLGNYCEIGDAVRGILTILKQGKNGEAYNVVNEQNTMTIREMAEMVCGKIAGGSIQVAYDIPRENIHGYAADTGLRLSGEKLMALGWRPQKNLEEMYRDMLEDWQAGENINALVHE